MASIESIGTSSEIKDSTKETFFLIKKEPVLRKKKEMVLKI